MDRNHDERNYHRQIGSGLQPAWDERAIPCGPYRYQRQCDGYTWRSKGHCNHGEQRPATGCWYTSCS